MLHRLETELAHRMEAEEHLVNPQEKVRSSSLQLSKNQLTKIALGKEFCPRLWSMSDGP
jgi:hypothetical protein